MGNCQELYSKYYNCVTIYYMQLYYRINCILYDTKVSELKYSGINLEQTIAHTAFYSDGLSSTLLDEHIIIEYHPTNTKLELSITI